MRRHAVPPEFLASLSEPGDVLEHAVLLFQRLAIDSHHDLLDQGRFRYRTGTSSLSELRLIEARAGSRAVRHHRMPRFRKRLA